MSWPPLTDELSDFARSLESAERVVGQAFARTATRHASLLGERAVHILRQEFRPTTATWWVIWWFDFPDWAAPYEELRCDLDLSPGTSGPELCGWISIRRYIGRGETVEDDLWHSGPNLVASPRVTRRVAADLVKHLRRVDLKAYLKSRSIEPDAAVGD